MSKPTITMIAGLPASGKTTLAKKIDALRFNLDDIRVSMGWTSREKWDRKKESAAVNMMIAGIEAAVDAGQDVVADNTFLVSRIPNKIRRRVGGRATYSVINLIDKVSVGECIRRDLFRDKSVGIVVIQDMQKRIGKWRLTDDYMNVWPEVVPVTVNSSDPAIIVDLDGTAAIHTNRDPYDAEKCDTDSVDVAVADIVHSWDYAWEASDHKKHKVIFLSGRDSIHREKTLKWLEHSFELPFSWELFMRPEGDSRPDFVVKYELFNEHLRDKYNVLFALDDRDQCIRLWRELGLRALQVGYGDF